MKKIVCVLVLACVIMGAAFAQQKPATPAAPAAPAKTAGTTAKNAVAWDVFRLFDGLYSFGGYGILGLIDGEEDWNWSDLSYFPGATLSFAYERQIVPHWSIGPNLDMGFFGYYPLFNFRLGLAAEGRYYPLSDFDKLFFGATFGFGVNVLSFLFFAVADFGIQASLKVGYKVVTSKKFYLEPSLGYGYKFSQGNFYGGLRLGFVF